MIYVKCSSPTCAAVTYVSAAQLSRGLFAVLPPRGWAFEKHPLDVEPNWFCPRCVQGEAA